MGLDYSIETFVRKEKLADSLYWLNQNSQGEETVILRLENGDYVDVHGTFFSQRSKQLNQEKVIYDVEELEFSTSLIFDIDPEIFTTFYNPFCNDPIADFKEYFENVYLGNGKLRIGFFDSNINKHKNLDVFILSFTAVTTNMSAMLTESLSVRNWIHEFSKISDSIVTFIDMEASGDKIVFYKGDEVDIQIEDDKRNIKVDDLENLSENHLYEYYKLTEFLYQ